MAATFTNVHGAPLPDHSTNAEPEFTPNHEIDFNERMPLYHGAQPLSSELKVMANPIRRDFIRSTNCYPRIEALEKAGALVGGPLYGVIVHNGLFTSVHEFWRYFMDCRLFNERMWAGLAAHSEEKARNRNISLPLRVKEIVKVKARGPEVKEESPSGEKDVDQVKAEDAVVKAEVKMEVKEEVFE